MAKKSWKKTKVNMNFGTSSVCEHMPGTVAAIGKKPIEIARRIRELREYKFDLKRAEDAFLAASRPGASCKAKPCKAQAKKELRKSKMKRER